MFSFLKRKKKPVKQEGEKEYIYRLYKEGRDIDEIIKNLQKSKQEILDLLLEHKRDLRGE